MKPGLRYAPGYPASDPGAYLRPGLVGNHLDARGERTCDGPAAIFAVRVRPLPGVEWGSLTKDAHMADQQMRPASPAQAPDPSFNYERSHPERESPAGTLDNKAVARATPAPTSDKIAATVSNAQDPQRSLTAQDAAPPQPAAGQAPPLAHAMPAPAQPDHSMKDEEPLGWDQAPQGRDNQRHPRTGGQGGTPDVAKG